jgi:hypothetical protein
MIAIKRNMEAKEVIKTANSGMDEYLPYSQASFNSDGCITLRNYDRSDKNRDEIIILSQSETGALFELFEKMGVKLKAHELPF